MYDSSYLDFNDSFSINSLFVKTLRIQPTPSELQFLSKGLKYATEQLDCLPIKKRWDKTLKNKSTQYDYVLKEYAVHLLMEHRLKKGCISNRNLKKSFIDCFNSCFTRR